MPIPFMNLVAHHLPVPWHLTAPMRIDEAA